MICVRLLLLASSAAAFSLHGTTISTTPRHAAVTMIAETGKGAVGGGAGGSGGGLVGGGGRLVGGGCVLRLRDSALALALEGRGGRDMRSVGYGRVECGGVA